MPTLKDLVDKVSRELQNTALHKLQEYILGGLSTRNRKEIERRMLEDEEFFQEILSAEENLVEDYVRDLLPTEKATRVTQLVNTSPEWRKRVTFAKAVNTLSEQRASSTSTNRTFRIEATYETLAELAKRALSRQSGEQLEPSELVHEAYMRMQSDPALFSSDRAQFLAMASMVMRRVLVDIARSERSSKRGGGKTSQLNPGELEPTVNPALTEERVLEIDMALNALTEVNPRLSRLVELKFFSGLAEDEISELLGVSARTVKRDWVAARSWLHTYLSAGRVVH